MAFPCSRHLGCVLAFHCYPRGALVAFCSLHFRESLRQRTSLSGPTEKCLVVSRLAECIQRAQVRIECASGDVHQSASRICLPAPNRELPCQRRSIIRESPWLRGRIKHPNHPSVRYYLMATDPGWTECWNVTRFHTWSCRKIRPA